MKKTTDMKLIKLKEDHYVIVADSEIKEGDWYLTFQNNEVIGEPRKCEDSTYSFIHCKKITHSTGVAIEDYWSVIELSLSEVKELVGEVDIEKKVYSIVEKVIGSHNMKSSTAKDMISIGTSSYNQALDDNKEKRYTEEDIRKVILVEMARKYLSDVAAFEINEIIQSLQPKTEWEVEFIDGKLTLKQ